LNHSLLGAASLHPALLIYLLEEVLVLDLLEVWVVQGSLGRDTLARLIDQHLDKEVNGKRIDVGHQVNEAL
jgi:hypothetical protein